MNTPASESSLLTFGRLSVARDALSFAVSRSSGPGGQNVNKQNTRVEMRLPLAAIQGLDHPIVAQRLRMLAGKRLIGDAELRIVSQETRSQELNREIALQQLADLFEEASKIPRTRHATKPSRGAKRRRLEGKKRRGEIKAARRPHDD